MQPERGFLTCSAICGIALISLVVINARDARAAATTAGKGTNLVVGQATTDRMAKAAPERHVGVGYPPVQPGPHRSTR